MKLSCERQLGQIKSAITRSFLFLSLVHLDTLSHIYSVFICFSDLIVLPPPPFRTMDTIFTDIVCLSSLSLSQVLFCCCCCVCYHFTWCDSIDFIASFEIRAHRSSSRKSIKYQVLTQITWLLLLKLMLVLFQMYTKLQFAFVCEWGW